MLSSRPVSLPHRIISHVDFICPLHRPRSRQSLCERRCCVSGTAFCSHTSVSVLLVVPQVVLPNGYTFKYPRVRTDKSKSQTFTVVDGLRVRAAKSVSHGYMVRSEADYGPLPAGHTFFVSEAALLEVQEDRSHFHKFGQRIYDVISAVS